MWDLKNSVGDHASDSSTNQKDECNIKSCNTLARQECSDYPGLNLLKDGLEQRSIPSPGTLLALFPALVRLVLRLLREITLHVPPLRPECKRLIVLCLLVNLSVKDEGTIHPWIVTLENSHLVDDPADVGRDNVVSRDDVLEPLGLQSTASSVAP